MKLFKAGTVLQMIYMCGCLVVVACMPLYRVFYETTFGLLCLRIGGLLLAVSTINPMGLLGTIMNIIACIAYKQEVSGKYVVRTVIAPVLLICSWLLAVCFFVKYTGV